MYDMAHTLGLYGAFQRPLEEGADIVTGSTHKTFFGPQRGVVVSNFEKGHQFRKLWTEVESRAFPGSTSNHHLGTLLGLLVATHEMNAFKSEYQTQVRKNAKAFAKALKAHGLEVEGDPADGYTDTHQVIVRVRKYGTGEEVARRLENNNIVCNYQALPDDPSFIESSGISTGVQEMTRFGMVEKDFDPLAGLDRRRRDQGRRRQGQGHRVQVEVPGDEVLPAAGGLRGDGGAGAGVGLPDQ